MGSSDDGGGNPGMLSQNVTPNPDVPVGGGGGGIDPWNYGMFQNFLPQPPTEQGGYMPPATGLTQDMFTYRPPNGITASDGLHDQQANAQRNALAGLMGGAGGMGGGGGWNPGNQILGADGMAHNVPPPTFGANGTPMAQGRIGTIGNGDPYAGWASYARPFYYQGAADPNAPDPYNFRPGSGQTLF